MRIVEVSEAPKDITGYKRGESRRWVYEFERVDASKDGLLGGALSKGDAVNVSIEPNLLALGRGFITELNRKRVVVTIDRELTVDVVRRGVSNTTSLAIKKIEDVVFRIDKDELAMGIARIRDNLAQLLYVKGDERRRSLIVDLQPPVFATPLPPCSSPESLSNTLVSNEYQCPNLPPVLNESQKAAAQKVLSTKDYALILGMPGTGKTTTIAEIIKILVKEGRRVLLASYTHSAVDTILRKLVDTDVNVLRLGQKDKVCGIISLDIQYC